MLKDVREFVMSGNVIDLAIGVIIGGAFKSFPTLAQAKAAGAPTLNYGLFLSAVLDFLIVAFAVFLLVRQINKLHRQPEPTPAPPATKECPFCVSAIAIQATRCPQCTPQLA